jgi:hypothetical protein
MSFILPPLLFVSQRSVKIEVTHKHPVDISIKLKVIEPKNKLISAKTLAWTIYSGQDPIMTIMQGREIDRYGELVNLNDFPIKDRAIPPHKNTSRISNRGGEGILVEAFGGQFLYGGVVKMISLSFLKTEDCTRAFINFLFYSIAFIFRVDSSDVPIEDVPASIQTRV